MPRTGPAWASWQMHVATGFTCPLKYRLRLGACKKRSRARSRTPVRGLGLTLVFMLTVVVVSPPVEGLLLSSEKEGCYKAV
jgi:hypothetical protein